MPPSSPVPLRSNLLWDNEYIVDAVYIEIVSDELALPRGALRDCSLQGIGGEDSWSAGE
jgi:hypothetical protein